MGRMLTRSALVTVVSYQIEAEHLFDLECQRCGSPMDLHQPDSNQPEQFLATCPECGLWLRVEAKADEPAAVAMQLPEVVEACTGLERPLRPPRLG